MDADQQRRAIDQALVPMIASLGGAGVDEAHWLPDRGGEPVVWLRTRTELGRVELQTNGWVLPQVQMMLTRLGVPYPTIARVRLEFTSLEAEERLFAEGGTDS